MRKSPIDDFWVRARAAVPTLPAAVPEAWAFGATTADADELLSFVLDGTKTGTASSLHDVEADGDALPGAGQLSVTDR